MRRNKKPLFSHLPLPHENSVSDWGARALTVKLQHASHMTMPIIAQGCGETLRSLTDIVAGLRPYLP